MVGGLQAGSRGFPSQSSPPIRRLSSKVTFFYKRLFPIFWFGLLLVFVVFALIGGRAGSETPIQVFIVPLFMAVFGYVIMKLLVFDLVDQVWDAGEALVVKNNNQEDRIPLANIINVSHSTFMNPARVTLTLRSPCRFGKEVAFSPVVSVRQSFNPFARPRIVTELIERVDSARRG